MQSSRTARAWCRIFASLVLVLFASPLHTWSTEPPIREDAELSARGVGTAARADAVEAGVSTNASIPGAAPTVESFKRASDYSARNGGRAVLVLVDGRIVFERYDNGFGPETATHLHSATKGFWGPVIAAMIEDGMIESFDELAAETLTEWKDHPRKGRITLRHLLTLSAGLVQDVANLQGHDRPTLAPDLYKHAIGVPALREPGAVFQYGPSCYYVLGEIMKRKLATRKQTPLDYLKQRILDPIGVKVGDWVHDASGNPHIPNGAHLTAREWMKYGQWLLQEGEWNGKPIVRKDLLHELTKPSDANRGHGLALWLNQPGGRGAVGVAAQRSEPGDKAGWIYREGCPDLFAALGAGKCRMYVIPSLKLVALRQGDSDRDRFEDNAFLGLLLEGGASNVSGRDVSMREVDVPENRRRAVQLFLRRFDRNGDDKIVPDEAGPRLKTSFNFLDTNRDGALDASELQSLLGRRDVGR
jgi:CubicO group peptidase (beta-lactamase class C family)